MNMYAYVANDPVNARDPNGEFAWVLGAALVGAVIDAAVEVASQVAEGKNPLAVENLKETGAAALRGGATGTFAAMGGGVLAGAAKVAPFGAKSRVIASAVGSTGADALVAGNAEGADGVDAAVGVTEQVGSGGVQGVIKAYAKSSHRAPGKIGKVMRVLNRVMAGKNGDLAAGAANATADSVADQAMEAIGAATCTEGIRDKC